ncbi:MAG: hypothetical protein IJ048_01610 [Clostridia bacterium]|nr:hypothetical protein [Clostridia bacterium]
MNVNKLQQQKKQVNTALNKSLEQSLEDWLDHELPKMIDEEIKKLQTTEDVEIALDVDSLEDTKKSIADVIKSCFQ